MLNQINQTKIQIYIEFKSGDKVYTLEQLKKEIESLKGEPAYQFFQGIQGDTQNNPAIFITGMALGDKLQ